MNRDKNLIIIAIAAILISTASLIVIPHFGNNEIISHNFLSYNPPKELEDLHDILTSNKISFTVNLSDKEGEVLFITDLGYDDNVSKLIWLVPTWLGDIINSKCGKAIVATCIIHDGKCNYSDMYG